MITVLINIFLKKYSNTILIYSRLSLRKLLGSRFRAIVVSLMTLLMALIPVLSRSQNQHLNYIVFQGGEPIGWLRLEKNIAGNNSNLSLSSEIKKWMIFEITVTAKEFSTFTSGKLIYSSQFRKTNGDTKIDKQTRFVADKYEVMKNGGKEVLPVTFIGTNLLSLYFQEPKGLDIVYCDNHECFVKITRTDDGGYKVKFPDGNSNIFYYSTGVCTRIMVNHTFYSVAILLNP